MRPTLLVVPLALVALAGCQGTEEAAPQALTAPAAPTQTGCSQTFDQPTVVRYLSRMDDRTQHSVHLLNASEDSQRIAGCSEVLPLASVVTLRYRVAGS